jgi:hypothetical protein
MSAWIKRLVDWRIWFILLVLAVSLKQVRLVEQDYAIIWLKRGWKNQTYSSIERSAQYYFGEAGTTFLKFIDSYVPQDKAVIVPGIGSRFSNQSILKYFLFPRTVLTCPCTQTDEACKACLQDPNVYIPATNNFPSKEAVGEAKQFIPFDSTSSSYAGLYVPKGEMPISPDQALPKAPYHPLPALLIDLCVLASFSLLGFILARLVIPWLGWIEALSLSVPLGVGLFTWVIFITSWSGIPIILPTVIIIFAVLTAGLFLLRRRLEKTPGDSPRETLARLRRSGLTKKHLIPITAWGLVGCIFLVMTTISVIRSYSQFDDIAIWSLKGYGIAYKGTIFATNYLGGHGLAYPLDLPLSITVFKLASGDVIPGSKLLFPIFSAALAFGCYRFWRRWGVNSILAWSGILLLVTVPEIFLYSTLGFANLPFTVYLVLGVFWSVDGLLRAQPRSLFMAGLLLAFASWTRPEGIVFAIILMVVLFLGGLIALRKPYFSPAWVLPLVIPVLWLLFAAQYVARDQAGGALNALVNDLFQGSLSLTPVRMMLGYAMSTVVKSTTWGYIFPLAAVMLVVAGYQLLPRVNPPAFMLFPAAIAAFLVPAGLFFVESTTEGDFPVFLSVSFDRAYLPAAFLIVASGILALGTLGAMKDTPPETG